MGSGQCNFCTFDQIKCDALKRGERAEVRSDPLGSGIGGCRVVYINKETKSERDAGYWFMEVGSRCAC